MRPQLSFVVLDRCALSHLVSGDLGAASARAGAQLTPYLVGPECGWLWAVRLEQLGRDPGSAPWIARAALDVSRGVVVGHAGFHGPPDDRGVVEVGYSVDPAHRRRGVARAMLSSLLVAAAAQPSVTAVRATISPDNAASLATIDGFGFVHIGEQWDEHDGTELVFEVSASTAARSRRGDAAQARSGDAKPAWDWPGA